MEIKNYALQAWTKKGWVDTDEIQEADTITLFNPSKEQVEAVKQKVNKDFPYMAESLSSKGMRLVKFSKISPKPDLLSL